MTRIEGPAALLHTMLAGQVAKAATAAPMELSPAPPPPVAQAGAPAPLPSVAMLVTMAAASPDERRKAEIASTGHGLDQLADLHADLVTGAVPPQRLRALRDWLRRRLRPDDPELAAITDEVELRVLVELAKLERDR